MSDHRDFSCEPRSVTSTHAHHIYSLVRANTRVQLARLDALASTHAHSLDTILLIPTNNFRQESGTELSTHTCTPHSLIYPHPRERVRTSPPLFLHRCHPPLVRRARAHMSWTTLARAHWHTCARPTHAPSPAFTHRARRTPPRSLDPEIVIDEDHEGRTTLPDGPRR